MKRRVHQSFVSALAAALVATGGTTLAAFAASAPTKVSIGEGRLTPATASVAPGGDVEWTNVGTKSHRVSSDTGAWQSFTLRSGGKHIVRFSRVGVFPYHVDARLHGKIVVSASLASTSLASSFRRYSFSGVRFDWRPQNAYFHDDISGRVCGRAGIGAWHLSVTVTNYIDPSNTGTVRVRVPVRQPGVATRGVGSRFARYVRLTVLRGTPVKIRVERSGVGVSGATHTAVVPLREGGPCRARG
jgi:plastocyanin